jgi:MYXO-CTERM domain-containing protein
VEEESCSAVGGSPSALALAAGLLLAIRQRRSRKRVRLARQGEG